MSEVDPQEFDDLVPVEGRGQPCITKNNEKIPGKGILAPQYDGPLPDIIPSEVNFNNWRVDQLDAFFNIPKAKRTNKETRLGWIQEFKSRNVNTGGAHEIAMQVSATMSKAVLATVRQEINQVNGGLAREITRVNTLEDKLEIWEKGQKIDKTSAKEILIAHKQTFDQIDEKNQDAARKEIFKMLKPLAKEWKDWRDIRKVKKIGSGTRARLVAELISNHLRERVICTWEDEPDLIKGYEGLELSAAKPAYDSWVGAQLYSAHKKAEHFNSSSDGKTFCVVEKPKNEKYKRPVEYPCDHPKVVKPFEAWKNKKKEAQPQSLSQSNHGLRSKPEVKKPD